MVEKYGNRLLVSKSFASTFVFGTIVACVAVGVITYYATVSGLEGDKLISGDDANPEPEPEPASSAVKKKVTDVRLPRHLRPEIYRVELVPFIIPDNFTIQGYVEIEMTCIYPAANVTLHVADIKVENKTVELMEKKGNAVNIREMSYDNDREFIIANLDNNLEVGKVYVIKIHFTAYLKDNLKGFYRSVYKDKASGKDEYIAVTQFQATDARRAFPCFDEPGIKAKYKVKLGRRVDMSSISNMPIEEKGMPMEGTTEYVWDSYQESVKMSTYLVAFVVSKFEFKEITRDNGVRFRIWSTPHSLDQTEYARDIGPKILQFFEEYFNVKFPLPKQDMIAIPDFGAGAMENWGLITYRETALLFKEGVSAVNNKQRIALVVSHELAHQWFGNLVTPSWWTDLWLNEGFASYVEYLGVEAIQPQLKFLEQFIINDLQDVLRIDALDSSHPISIPVKHPDEISEIFDRISYGKGASIIRMMDKFLTTETFRQGLTNYLTKLQFEAAEQDDLWQHLTEQGHKDGTLPLQLSVKTIMDTWTLQMGFPLLTVTRNYNSNSAKVTQEKFRVSGKKSSNDVDSKDYRWWIPITYVAPGGDFNNTYNTIWMKESDEEMTVPNLPNSDEAVVFNIQETGYYRVNYDLQNWKLLAAQLEKDHKSIHLLNRAQMIDDALNLAKSGYLDYSTALSVTGYLKNEVEYVPWASALNGLAYLNTMLKRSAAYGEFKRYMLKLIDPIYAKLGFNPKPEDTHLDILLRKKVASWACSMGNEDCQAKAKDNFAIWMGKIMPDDEEANPIDVNMKYVTYCNAIANGGEEEWDFAWKRYENSEVASEKATLLGSLSCTKEMWILNRFLNMTVTPDSGVRKQDGSKVIGGIAGSIIGRDIAFDFLREHWQLIKEYFPGFSAARRTVKSISASFSSQFELNELKSFASKHKDGLGTAKRAVEQAIEGGEANLDWMNRNYESIFSWLNAQNKERNIY